MKVKPSPKETKESLVNAKLSISFKMNITLSPKSAFVSFYAIIERKPSILKKISQLVRKLINPNKLVEFFFFSFASKILPFLYNGNVYSKANKIIQIACFVIKHLEDKNFF